jgi:hypothetical protein
MDVRVAPQRPAKRLEIGAPSKRIAVAGIVVLAASDARDEKDCA